MSISSPTIEKILTVITEKTVSFLTRSLLHPKVCLQGKENPLSEPSVLIINHTGHLDGPVVNSAFKKIHIHSLAAKDRFGMKMFGFFLRHTRCIPIDRQNPDVTWIHEALRVLNEEKEFVAIYPEGRHGEHRKQLPFHPGVVILAAVAKKPLVMIYVDGPARFFHSTGLIVSEPFSLDPPVNGLDGDYLEEQAVKLQERMKDLMEEYIRRNDR